MLLAQDVLHAYTMISISIMVVFTSLTQPRDGEKRWRGRTVTKRDMSERFRGEKVLEFSISMCVPSYLETVWITKTSLPRTDSWICTRVSMETNRT